MLPSSAQTVLALVFLLQSTSSFSQDFDCTPPTFFKRVGNPDRREFGNSVVHSSDGNLYISGRAGTKAFLQKVNFAGEPIWMRSLNVDSPQSIDRVRLIEDSEGMIVGSGTQEIGSAGYRAFVFRYDPVADSLLWARFIASDDPGGGGDIVEKTPGGNFLFSHDLNTDYDLMFIDYEIEIIELDRATGNIVPGFAKRYGYIYLDRVTKMVTANGALYGLGTSTCRHDFGYKSNRLLLARFDPADGTPIWAQLSHADTLSKADFDAQDLVVDGNALVAAYTMDEDASSWPAPDGSPHYINLQKTDLNGNVLWIRQYGISFGAGTLKLLVVPDGYVLSAGGAVFKVNKNGDFLWGRSLPFVSFSLKLLFGGLGQAAIEGDSLYFAGHLNALAGDFDDMFFWKILSDGSMTDSCDLVSALNLDVVDIQNPVITPITLQHFPSSAVSFPVNATWSPDSMAESFFCPQYAPMSLTCPADIEVSVAAGASGISVNYNLPTGASDCDCPGFDFTLSEGLSSGSLFPVGETQVCYSAADDCGTSAACCFKVAVRQDQESPCDTKTIGCVRYDLLSITADAQKRRTYRVRVTNNCSNKLIYTAVQLPDGITADLPANLSNYTSPEGRDYAVRNPSYSPFYSIRFKSVTDGIANGESDVFEYTLPPQAQPSYIHVTSRLEPQVFHEAHLNTFNCPIGVTPSQNRSESATGRRQTAATVTAPFSLFPNPSSSDIFADLSGWQGQDLSIQILDSRGQRVQSLVLQAQSEAQPVPLESQLADGLYFLQIVTEQGERAAARFVLKR